MRSPVQSSAEMHERLALAMHKERLLSFDGTLEGDPFDEDLLDLGALPQECATIGHGMEANVDLKSSTMQENREDRGRNTENMESLVERKIRESRKRDVLEANRTMSRLSKREITSSLLDTLNSSATTIDPHRSLSSPELESNIPIHDEDKLIDDEDESLKASKSAANRGQSRKVLDGLINVLRKKKPKDTKEASQQKR